MRISFTSCLACTIGAEWKYVIAFPKYSSEYQGVRENITLPIGVCMACPTIPSAEPLTSLLFFWKPHSFTRPCLSASNLNSTIGATLSISVTDSGLFLYSSTGRSPSLA